MKKVYYARSLDFYGTPIDQHWIRIINNLCCQVVDPNEFFNKDEYDEKGMDMFFERIKDCDLLIFKANRDGNITAGVHKEILCAWDNDIPALEIPNTIWSRALDKNETREYLKRVGAR